MDANTRRTTGMVRLLAEEVPDIGFLNRRRRIRSYLAVTGRVQAMIHRGLLTRQDALAVLAALCRDHRPFRSAATTAACRLYGITAVSLPPIGLAFAQGMRRRKRVGLSLPWRRCPQPAGS